MSEIRRAVVKSYDAATHKADVQIAGSLAVWLDGVRVATSIPAADVVADRQCSVLFLDPSNQDEAVVIAIQGALPSTGELLLAAATSSLTLTTTAQSITGDGDSSKVRLLLPTPGDWLIELTCDFQVTSAGGTTLVAELFVNDSGSAEPGQALMDAADLDRGTHAQRWKVTTTAANTPVEIKARKTVAAGSVQVNATHTRMTALLLTGGNAGPLDPSGTVVSETAFGQAAAAGSATPYSRGDHTHGTPTDPVTAHVAIADAHHAKYLDAEAIAAVEGEVTLALAGAVTIASTLAVTDDLALTAAIKLGNDGIEDRFGTQRVVMSSGFPFAERVRIKGAVSGITLAVQDGDLDIEDGDLAIQDLALTRVLVAAGTGLRIQPTGPDANDNVAIQAVPRGTATLATFDMFNDSGAADANRVRFGAGPVGLGIELATGMQLDFAIAGATQMLHLTDTEGFFKVPLLIGTNADPATSAVLELRSTTGALLLPRMTTTQRNALTAVNGMIIYNTTTNGVEAYENGAWVNV